MSRGSRVAGSQSRKLRHHRPPPSNRGTAEDGDLRNNKGIRVVVGMTIAWVDVITSHEEPRLS